MVFFKGEIYIAFRYVRLEVEGGLNWVDKVGIGVMVANERIQRGYLEREEIGVKDGVFKCQNLTVGKLLKENKKLKKQKEKEEKLQNLIE